MTCQKKLKRRLKKFLFVGLLICGLNAWGMDNETDDATIQTDETNLPHSITPKRPQQKKLAVYITKTLIEANKRIFISQSIYQDDQKNWTLETTNSTTPYNTNITNLTLKDPTTNFELIERIGHGLTPEAFSKFLKIFFDTNNQE